MSAPAWTPAPWTACHEGNCQCGFIFHENAHIATAMGPKDLGADWCGADQVPGEAMQHANCKLIAAAPDFADIAARAQYRANELGGDYSDLTMDELCSFMVEFDAALSKARGEQP